MIHNGWKIQLPMSKASAGIPMPGAILVTKGEKSASSYSIMVRVKDVDSHHTDAVRQGVRILNFPIDYPYGERQYTAEDPDGHRWTFSQTIEDVDPGAWGGTLIE